MTGHEPAGTIRQRGGFGAAILLTVAAVIIGLGLCEVAARLLWPAWRDFNSARFQAFTFVPGYGMTVAGKAGFDGWFAQNDGDFRVPIRLNTLGFREPEPPGAANGRVWILGDSLAFGWGVKRSDTFAAVAARNAGITTYNLASPGANICDYQAAVARMPESAAPRAAIVAVTIENDIAPYMCPRGKGPSTPAPTNDGASNNTLSFAHVKLALLGHSAFYNGLAIGIKRIPLINRLLIRVGLVAAPHTRHGIIDPDKADDSITRTAAEVAFIRNRLPAGTPFAVLLVPSRFDIRDKAKPDALVREHLVAALHAQQLQVIDPVNDFRAAGFGPTHFAHDGHWSPRGHAVAGEALAHWLKNTLDEKARP
jgi:hypothetical protein